MKVQSLLNFYAVVPFEKTLCDYFLNVIALVVIEMHCATSTGSFKIGFKTKGFYIQAYVFEGKNNDLIMLFQSYQCAMLYR